jgi:transcriptional regulator with XRE-family HTH domain
VSSPEYYEALGRAIRVARVERGLERKDLAERSGLSYPYVSEIESGRKRASSRALMAIAQALGLTPAELMAAGESRLATQSPAMPEPERIMPAEVAPAAAAAIPPVRMTPSSKPRSRFFHRTAAGPRDDEMVIPGAPAVGSSAPTDELMDLVDEIEALDESDRALVVRLVRRLSRRS